MIPVDSWRLRSCAFYFLHARLRVHRAPGIPHALIWADDLHNPGAACRGKADSYPVVITRLDREIQHSKALTMEIERLRRTGYPACGV